MKRIIDKRGTGKTKQLLEYAWSNGAAVVCSNPLAMKDKAQAYGFYGLKFLSYKDYFYQPYETDNIKQKYVVDEIEKIFLNDIIGYTLTNED